MQLWGCGAGNWMHVDYLRGLKKKLTEWWGNCCVGMGASSSVNVTTGNCTLLNMCQLLSKYLNSSANKWVIILWQNACVFVDLLQCQTNAFISVIMGYLCFTIPKRLLFWDFNYFTYYKTNTKQIVLNRISHRDCK